MVHTLLTQIKHRYYAVDCGMGYVFRLSDGRFVIIDGGYPEVGEAAHLHNILQAQNTCNTITIAAWFISHPHEDHYGVFVDFCRLYADECRIERVIYAFPTPDTCPYANAIPTFSETLQRLSDTECIVAERGQRFCFADAVFDILLTHRDMSHPIPNLNDTSMIVRTTVSGHRILWLGDGQQLVADRLCELYSADDLKCDILQVGHHGYGGGSDALHRTVHPSTLLWPVPDFTYQWVKDWDCNTYLMTADCIQRRYISGQTEITLDLDAPLPDTPKKSSATSGETVYHERFRDLDIYDLGWCCITGGSVEYQAAELELTNGQCRLRASTPPSVCEILQPHILCCDNGYTLTIRCRQNAENAQCGIIWNDDTPMKRDINRALSLPLPITKTVTVQLTIDRATDTTTLSIDGEQTHTAPYSSTIACGLYLVLQNADLVIEEIKVVAQ